MNAQELKAVQAPLKAAYREEPGKAVVTLRAEARALEGIVCRLETAQAIVEAGLHPAGGDGTQACSGNMLLQACAGVTLSAVGTSLGIPLRDARVLVEGDLVFRGTLGVARDAPVGFRAIRLHFVID